MDMRSMTYTFIFALIAVVVLGIGYVLVRRHGARVVSSDHTADPTAPRSDDFGAADRARAVKTAGHEDPPKLEDPSQDSDLTP